MPAYVHVRTTKPRDWGAGWHTISWDDVVTGNDVAKADSPSIMIGGHVYTATLLAQITSPTGSSTIRSRTTEGDTSGPDGAYQTLETNAAMEHPTTTGDTSIQDTRHGKCNTGNRLRTQVYVPYDGSVLVSADLTVLFW